MEFPLILKVKKDQVPSEVVNSNWAHIVNTLESLIDDAVTNKKDVVNVFSVEFEKQFLTTIQFVIPMDKCGMILQKMIDTSIKREEYELCRIIQNIIDKFGF